MGEESMIKNISSRKQMFQVCFMVTADVKNVTVHILIEEYLPILFFLNVVIHHPRKPILGQNNIIVPLTFLISIIVNY